MSQTTVAALMGTSQSSLARIEAGKIDARISTVERFAVALGDRLDHRQRTLSGARRLKERRTR